MRAACLAFLCASALLSACGAVHTSLAPLGAREVLPRCSPVAGLPAGYGVEDVAPDAGGVFASVADWPGLAAGAPRPGKLFFVHPDGRGGAVAEDRTPPGAATLFPHGLDVWRPKPGAADGARLFIVNHPGGDGPSRVELFAIGPKGQLTALPESPGHILEIHRPNDVAAAGPHSFYVSHDHDQARRSWSKPRLAELLEDVIGARSAGVWFVDLQTGTRTSTPAAFPNGLALSADSRTLYASETTRAAVRRFAVDGKGGFTAAGKALPAPRMADNLYLEDDRYLWIASHRSAIAFAQHALSWGKPPPKARPVSPGRVLRYDLADPDAPPQLIYETTTKGLKAKRGLSAVSVAASLGEGFLVGSIYEGLQYCDRRAGPT